MAASTTTAPRSCWVAWAEIVSEIIEDPALRDDHYEEMVGLRPWLMTERFDRRALNRALAGLDWNERAA